jgi:hypothetical protein
MTNNTERKALIKLAEDAGFVLNPIGQLVVPAPHDDATPYLERFLKAALSQREPVGEWIDGVPPHPYDKEWFIAKTTYGDKVVLTALPEEYAYDFKTADDTYIKADKIKCWMQFPDSEYKQCTAPAPSLCTAEEAAELAWNAAGWYVVLSDADQLAAIINADRAKR